MFQTLFSINPCQHPIVILKDVKFTDLQVIIDFMYYGEVSVSQEQLPHILKTAEMLKIKGKPSLIYKPSGNAHNCYTWEVRFTSIWLYNLFNNAIVCLMDQSHMFFAQ